MWQRNKIIRKNKTSPRCESIQWQICSNLGSCAEKSQQNVRLCLTLQYRWWNLKYSQSLRLQKLAKWNRTGQCWIWLSLNYVCSIFSNITLCWEHSWLSSASVAPEPWTSNMAAKEHSPSPESPLLMFFCFFFSSLSIFVSTFNYLTEIISHI